MRNYIRKIFQNINKKMEEARIQMIQQKCKHEHWNCDTQIRTIECKSCGLRAWIDDYVNLYNKL